MSESNTENSRDLSSVYGRSRIIAEAIGEAMSQEIIKANGEGFGISHEELRFGVGVWVDMFCAKHKVPPGDALVKIFKGAELAALHSNDGLLEDNDT